MRGALPYDELKGTLSAAPGATGRRLYFAAMLADATGIPTDDFIVVGGSAIEVYTVGEYSSGDIDIVSSQRERIRAVLRSWDFRREGRVWVHEELGLVVDLPGHPYTGSLERTTILTTPHGPVRLAAPEDLLVKRLISAKFWKQKGDLDHAKLLAAELGDRMDWGYVEDFARREDVSDVLAALRDALSKSRKRSTG